MSLLKMMYEQAGFCCAYSYLRHILKKDIEQLEKELGISSRTLYHWRRKLYQGHYTSCSHCPPDTEAGDNE